MSKKNLFDYADKLKNDGFENEQSSHSQKSTNEQTAGQNLFENDVKSQDQSSKNHAKNIDESTLQSAKQTYEKYKNFSQNELVDEFVSLSKERLKNGSLSPQKLKTVVDEISPFLNNTQKDFLKNLMGKIDE